MNRIALRKLSTAAADFDLQLARLQHWSAETDAAIEERVAQVIAEGLRVQFFWRLTRIDDCAADHYLRTQRTEMDWIRMAIMSLSVVSRPPRERPIAIGLEIAQVGGNAAARVGIGEGDPVVIRTLD